MTIEMDYTNLLENFKLHYSNLREEFLHISKPYVEATNILEHLKNHYSNVIKSERTSDYIKNLEGLLRTLEIRNALSYENIDPLKFISSQYVRDPALARLLENYEERLVDRPVVPLLNVYDLASGKYYVEDISGDRRLVAHVLSNNNVHCLVNHDQRTYRDDITHNYMSELPGRIQSPLEDTLINETKSLVQNNVTTIDEENTYGINNCNNIFIDKARRRISSYTATAIISFLAATFFTILFITITDVTSSAPRYEAQPGILGLGTSSRDSQRHQIRAQMTLYTTTQPAFHLTLPGSVEIGNTEQISQEEDTEIVRAVLLEVSEKLGRHWRDVARFLGVTEYDIDEIDYHSQLPLKEKAFKALLKFQSKCDPIQWKSKLQRALEKARRKDLMEMVEDLSSRKYRST